MTWALIAILLVVFLASIVRWICECYAPSKVGRWDISSPFFNKWGPLIAMVVIMLGFLIIGSV